MFPSGLRVVFMAKNEQVPADTNQGIATLDRPESVAPAPAPVYQKPVALKRPVHERIAVFWKDPRDPADAKPRRFGGFNNHIEAAKFITNTRKNGAEIKIVYVNDDGFPVDEQGNIETQETPRQNHAIPAKTVEPSLLTPGLSPRRMIQQLLDALSHHPDCKVKYVMNAGSPGKTEALPHIAPGMQEKLTIQLIYRLDK
jgi:hypothetical protein